MIEREAFLSTEENFVTMPFFWGKKSFSWYSQSDGRETGPTIALSSMTHSLESALVTSAFSVAQQPREHGIDGSNVRNHSPSHCRIAATFAWERNKRHICLLLLALPPSDQLLQAPRP